MDSKNWSPDGSPLQLSDLKAIVEERNKLRCELNIMVYKETVQKAQTERLENAYKACIAGLKKNLDFLSKLQARKQSECAERPIDVIFEKLDTIIEQGQELSAQMKNLRPPPAPKCGCGKEVESLMLAQSLIFDEFQMKMAEHERIRQKLVDDIKRQEEVYLRKIDILQMNIRGQQDNTPSCATCSICLDPWTSSGSHRSVSLACGHVFGEICIRLHLNRDSDCPLCRAPANSVELRNIYLDAACAI